MPLIAFSLIILSALLHATWNISANLAAKKNHNFMVLTFFYAFGAGVIWAPLNGYIAFNNNELSFFTWNSLQWLIVCLSAVVHAFYCFVLLYGYKVAPLSVVYPIARGSGPLFSSLCAIFLFNEPVTILSVSGILLIVFGVLLLAKKSKNLNADHSAIKRGIFWGVLTGINIALYTLLDAYAVKTLHVSPIVCDYMANSIRALILLPAAFILTSEVKSIFKQSLRSIILVAFLGPISYMLVLYAMQLAPVSHVAPARELSMMFGAFFGSAVLQEGDIAKRVLASCFIAFGVIALTLS